MKCQAGRGRLPFVLAALSFAGCIVGDGDGLCSKNQVLIEGPASRSCGCAEGYVLDVMTGCKPCGENETVMNGACICASGFTRPAEGAACAMSALGASCSNDSGCSGDSPYCESAGQNGYCTSRGCVSSADCQRGFLCDQKAGTSVCKKAPAGYGQSCQSAADCAGTEATFCDSFSSKSCVVQNCSQTTPCPGDWSCCDIKPAGATLCIEPAGLMDGACPGGGTLVPR